MKTKQRIAIMIMRLQNKIGDYFAESENEINWRGHDLLAEITMRLDEVIELVAEMEELEDEDY